MDNKCTSCGYEYNKQYETKCPLCGETMEQCTFEEVLDKSLEWCNQHPGWKRMCDIEDTDSLFKTWEELPKRSHDVWISAYGEYSAEKAWEEFGHKPCKVKYGHVSGKGEFYKDIRDIPLFHNSMMVFKVG